MKINWLAGLCAVAMMTSVGFSVQATSVHDTNSHAPVYTGALQEKGIQLVPVKDATSLNLSNGPTIALPAGVTAFDPNHVRTAKGKIEPLFSAEKMKELNANLHKQMKEQGLLVAGKSAGTMANMDDVTINGIRYYQLKSNAGNAHHVAYVMDVDVTAPVFANANGQAKPVNITATQDQLHAVNQMIHTQLQGNLDTFIREGASNQARLDPKHTMSPSDYRQFLGLMQGMGRLFDVHIDRFTAQAATHSLLGASTRFETSLDYQYDGFVLPMAAYGLVAENQGKTHMFLVLSNDADHAFWSHTLDQTFQLK